MVNATQAFPFYPLDVKAMSIDVLTASVHKWGFTGHIGTVFFTSAAFREKYPGPVAGWLSVKPEGKSIFHTAKNTPFSLYDSARRYDLGTHNLQLNLAFQASLDYLKSIGFENIRERIVELTDYLIEGLKSLGADIISPIDRVEERSAIVAFSLGGRNKACIKNLKENNIFVSYRDGKIRVSLNIFNNFEDIDSLVNSITIFLDSPG
jgi:selenocysteine lyase/cysteine desulfurase